MMWQKIVLGILIILLALGVYEAQAEEAVDRRNPIEVLQQLEQSFQAALTTTIDLTDGKDSELIGLLKEALVEVRSARTVILSNPDSTLPILGKMIVKLASIRNNIARLAEERCQLKALSSTCPI